MKEKTNIKHRLKDNTYCTETLDKEYWGGNYRFTCMKCGFAKIINNNVFLEWLSNNEVK